MKSTHPYTLAAALATLTACAGSTPPPVAAKPARDADRTAQPPSRQQLANGLTLVLQPNRSAKVVSLQLWVHAGAADEQPGEYGAAHMLEHMLWRATDKRAAGEIERLVEGAGGGLEAWTSYDATVFQIVIASRYFDLGAEVLADAAQNPKLDEEELKAELAVVREELKRAGARPDRQLSNALFETAYTRHPYRRPVIGTEEAAQKLTREALMRFYGRAYTPENMTLVVVGDFDRAAVAAKLTAAFGGLRRAAKGASERPAEPEQTEPRVRVIPANIDEVRLSYAWPIPGIKNEDIHALNLLSVILGDGESARLMTRLKRDKKLVDDAYGFAFIARDPGLFSLGATTTAANAKDAQIELLREVYRLRTEVVSDAELRKAKTIVLSDAYFQKESMSGAARKLGFFEVTADDVSFEERFYNQIEKVTVQDLRRVAARYLTTQHLNAVALVPKQSPDILKPEALLAAARGLESAVQAQPMAPPPKPSALGIYKMRLPSGATLLVQEDHSVPIVAMQAAFIGGVRFEDKQNNGVSYLLARLLTRSTKRRTHVELRAQLDAMAARLDGFASYNALGVRGEFLKSNVSDGLELIAEVVNQPGFGKEDVDRERAQVLAEVRSHEDNGAAAAFDLFSEALFDTNPLRLRLRGTVETVSSLRADDILNYYQRNYGRDKMVLAVVGDVRADEIYFQCQRLFSQGNERLVAPPQVAPEPPLAQPRRVEKAKERTQAHVVLGFRSAPLMGNDRFALDVLAQVLAGQEGRLTKELRGKASLVSRVSSVTIEALDTGYFATYVGTSPDRVEAILQTVRRQVDTLAKGPAAPDEIERAKRYLIGAHAVAVQATPARAAALALHEAFGQGVDAEAKYEDRIQAVTAADVQRVAKIYLDLNRSVTAIVKPAPKTADATPNARLTGE